MEVPRPEGSEGRLGDVEGRRVLGQGLSSADLEVAKSQQVAEVVVVLRKPAISFTVENDSSR